MWMNSLVGRFKINIKVQKYWKTGNYEDDCWRDLKCGKCGYTGNTTDRFWKDPRNNYMKERYYLNKTKYQNYSD